MITGIHAMFYSPQPEELRVFFRDKLGLPSVDLGDGWLIFPVEGEVGFHPGSGIKHEVSLYCDDIYETVKELQSRSVQFADDIQDWGFGMGTFIDAPGGLRIQLYQPNLASSPLRENPTIFNAAK